MNLIVICCLMIIARSAAITNLDEQINSIKIEEPQLESTNQYVKIEDRNSGKDISKEKELKPTKMELDFKCDISSNKRIECMEKCKEEGYSGSTCRLFKKCKCFKRRRDCRELGEICKAKTH